MKTNLDTLLRDFFIGKTLIKVETSPQIYNKKIVDIEFALDIPKEIEEVSNSYVSTPFARIEVPREQGDRDQISDDVGTPSDDTGTLSEDTGTPSDDAGTLSEDTGTPSDDAGTLSEDTGTPSDAILIPDNNMETSRPYGVSGVTFLLEDMSTVFVQDMEDIEVE